MGKLYAVLLQAFYLTLDSTTVISVFLIMWYFTYFTCNPIASSLCDTEHESLLTLLNRQHGLQKQSFNMIQNITHRQEYENLTRDIPINDGKNMDLADWLLQKEEVALLSHSQEY